MTISDQEAAKIAADIRGTAGQLAHECEEARKKGVMINFKIGQNEKGETLLLEFSATLQRKIG